MLLPVPRIESILKGHTDMRRRQGDNLVVHTAAADRNERMIDLFKRFCHQAWRNKPQYRQGQLDSLGLVASPEIHSSE